MSSSEEFTEVLDLSQTTTDASQCSDTYQMSPDLFSPDEEDLPIPKHSVASHSCTNAKQNDSSIHPSVLTLARRKLLAKLPATRQSAVNMTLYEDIIRTQTDQMFSLCTMTTIDQCKSTLGSFKLHKMVSTKRNLDHSRCEMNSVHDSKRKKARIEQDVAEAEVVQVNCLATPADVAEETPPNAQLTLAVKPASSGIMNIDEHAIPDNDRRSFVVNNIDIYRNVHRCPVGKYVLHDVPFQHVIVTGVITSKSPTRRSITQLEVDDGTALVNCLFDDLLCLPEHRNNFHTYLESWKRNQRLFRTDAVFDETFHFLREYAKRLFQETPQSDDLNTGDEVTIVGKVYDSKNEGRVIYHKYMLRHVDLASRENCDYVQNQFAKHGRHF